MTITDIPFATETASVVLAREFCNELSAMAQNYSDNQYNADSDKWNIARLVNEGWEEHKVHFETKKEGHDAHHALIHHIKKGGKTKYPILNDPRNLILVNHKEHINRKFDTHEWRKRFWKKQVERFGEPAMMEWINSLPAKLIFRIDFIER